MYLSLARLLNELSIRAQTLTRLLNEPSQADSQALIKRLNSYTSLVGECDLGRKRRDKSDNGQIGNYITSVNSVNSYFNLFNF